MERQSRNGVAATLALALAGVVPATHADDGFITQPQSRAQRARLTAPVQVAAQTHLSTFAASASTSAEPQVQAGIEQRITPSGTSGLPATHRDGQLRWVPSGSLQREPASQPNPPVANRGPWEQTPRVDATASRTQGLDLLPSAPTTAVASSILHTNPLELANPSFVEPREATRKIEPEASTTDPSSQAPKQASPHMQLAARISNHILAGDSDPPSNARFVPLDTTPGWQSVGQRLSQHIADCESLIRRGAYHSAREEASSAALHLVQVLDQAANSFYSEHLWRTAIQATVEAEDFSIAGRQAGDRELLHRLVVSHETPALKGKDLGDVSPLAAAAHYRLYAESQLNQAAQGHPWASEVYYALGRAYQAEADATGDASAEAARWKAVTFFRSAAAIDPNNSLAFNQLGFILLQMDRPGDARDALVRSVSAQPTRAGLENLIEASRRLSDATTHQWAMQNYLALQAPPSPASLAPQVIEVDPRTFAAMSPRNIGPLPQAQTGQHTVAAQTVSHVQR